MTSENRRAGRGDDGLTTLEWLLIVAAVASLAALAVVVVAGSVGETADRVSNSEARAAAAAHTAFGVVSDAKAASAGDFDSWGDWERHFRRECSLIDMLYADAGVQVLNNNFNGATGATAFDVAAAGHAAAADEQPATAAKAQVQCDVG